MRGLIFSSRLTIFLMVMSFNFDIGYCQNKYGNSVLVGYNGLTAIFNDTNKPQLKRYLPFYSIHTYFSTSSISDSATGRPLLFCNSRWIIDTNGIKIDNGDHLVDSYCYDDASIYVNDLHSQNSIFLPLGNKRYFLGIVNITDSSIDNCWNGTACLPVTLNCDDWRYNIIDMNLNNGAGRVVVKNAHLLYKTYLKVAHQTACKHANGKDWWLFKPANDPVPKMYRFLITSDSIYGPYEQLWDDGVIFDANRIGQMQFSPDGSRYASVLWFTNKVITGDFDRCTGLFSNRRVYSIPIDTLKANLNSDSVSQGVAFSPNNQFIYVTKAANVLQLDTQEPDSSLAWYLVKKDGDSVISSVYNAVRPYGNLFNGPDGRIYVGHFGGTFGLGISVIEHPNEKGILCGWCNQCLNTPILDSNYLVNMANQPNYSLGPTNNPNCWPAGMPAMPLIPPNELIVYPNPSNTSFFIKNKKDKKKEMYNAMGSRMLTTYGDEIDVSRLTKGVYYIRCDDVGVKVVVE